MCSSDLIYPVDTVLHKGSMYFNWLSLLDTNVVVIFALMLCVAGFTLVSSLFLIVLERVSTIGILRTLGASRRLIRGIFRRMAMRRNMPRISRLDAPRVRNMPIVETRSSTIRKRLDTSVNPATQSISANITTTLVSRSDSQLKYIEPLCSTVSTG